MIRIYMKISQQNEYTEELFERFFIDFEMDSTKCLELCEAQIYGH